MANSYDSRRHEPRVTVIGGGTGISTMLRGLKKHTGNLTAIVAVTDDGGGSGVLRSELGLPPPGDIRNCIQALANTEPTMEELLDYRFTEGSLKGQSFGNLFLAALNGMSGSFDEAVLKMSEVLAVTGRVLPVSNEDIRLVAEFENGEIIRGETAITQKKQLTDARIQRIALDPENAEALPASLDAIRRAELIVLGPGSLYTSVIPNLLVSGVADAIADSDAVRVYVCNVMTQDGETEGYTISDHARAIQNCCDRRLFDICLANSGSVPLHILRKYAALGAAPTTIDADEIASMGLELVTDDIAGYEGDLARHDPDALASSLMRIFRARVRTRIY